MKCYKKHDISPPKCVWLWSLDFFKFCPLPWCNARVCQQQLILVYRLCHHDRTSERDYVLSLHVRWLGYPRSLPVGKIYVNMPVCVNVPNFLVIGQTVAEIWQFFHFQDGGRRHLVFSKCGNFRCGEGSWRPKCITMPNFAAIGQTVAEIWRFFKFFNMAAAAVLDF